VAAGPHQRQGPKTPVEVAVGRSGYKVLYQVAGLNRRRVKKFATRLEAVSYAEKLQAERAAA
jgi:hypothetical protein